MPKAFKIQSADDDGVAQTYEYSAMQCSCMEQIPIFHLLAEKGLGVIAPALMESDPKKALLEVAEALPNTLRNSSPEELIQIMDFCALQTSCTSHKPPGLDRRAWDVHFRGRIGDAMIFAKEVLEYNFANFTEQFRRIIEAIPDKAPTEKSAS